MFRWLPLALLRLAPGPPQPPGATGSATTTVDRVADLMAKAIGGLAAGLSIQRGERLRVDFVAPVGASPVPRSAGSPLVLEGPAGPLEVIVRVAGAGGVKAVRVNGQPQTVDAQGLLSIPVTVGDARTSVLVQAEDPAGAKAQAELVLVQRSAPCGSAEHGVCCINCCRLCRCNGCKRCQCCGAPAGCRRGTRCDPHAGLARRQGCTATVAGQCAWHSSSRTRSTSTGRHSTRPRADAQSVAAILKDRFGFDVTVVQDVTRQQLLGRAQPLAPAGRPRRIRWWCITPATARWTT